MAGLLYKDLILNKKNLLSIGGAQLIFSLEIMLIATSSDGISIAEELSILLNTIFTMLMFIIHSMTVANILEKDENRSWANFISSSPAGVRGQLGAKYMFIFLSYILLLNWCVLLSNIIAVLGGEMNSSVAFDMLCIMLLFHAVELPFSVRLGSKYGGHVKTAAMIIIALIAMEIILFGDVDIFNSPENFFSALFSLFEKENTDKMLWLYAIFPYFSIAMYYLSYKLSCKLYQKGAENYE